jgi:uncharacterized membrane protein YsdA (DUF1294 family)
MTSWQTVMTLLPYVGSILLSFGEASVKAFQSRNIAHGHEKPAFYTSVLVSSTNVANITFVVMGGWWVLLPIAIGGSFGTVFAMRLHKHLFKEKA